jgi:hypothetical protein
MKDHNDTPFFWLDKERFFSMFGQPPQLSDYEPERKKRIPKYQEEGLYQQPYEGDGDET